MTAINNVDQHAIRAWLTGMGWSCCFFDDDLKIGCQCQVFHPDYGEGYVEGCTDGAALVRPGGESGYIFCFEQTLHWYDNESYETDLESPFRAVLLDVANEFINQHVPRPCLNGTCDCGEWESCPYQHALSGSLSWWRDQLPLIPDEEKYDERGLAWLDRHQHSPAGMRLLRHVLLGREAAR